MKETIDVRAHEIYLKGKTNLEFFLIHGYCGSPTDFGHLPEFLNKKYDATVRAITLPGHGISIDKLDNLNYKEFLIYAREELQKDIKAGKKIILGGFSFGSFIALKLSSESSIVGLFAVSAPHKLKFPFNIYKIENIELIKKYWGNLEVSPEIENKFKPYYYKKMHIRGLKVIKEANDDMPKYIKNIKIPSLFIHSSHDSISKSESAKKICDQISSEHKQHIIYDNKFHSIFLSYPEKLIFKDIGNFVDRAININNSKELRYK